MSGVNYNELKKGNNRDVPQSEMSVAGQTSGLFSCAHAGCPFALRHKGRGNRKHRAMSERSFAEAGA